MPEQHILVQHVATLFCESLVLGSCCTPVQTAPLYPGLFLIELSWVLVSIVLLLQLPGWHHIVFYSRWLLLQRAPQCLWWTLLLCLCQVSPILNACVSSLVQKAQYPTIKTCQGEIQQEKYHGTVKEVLETVEKHSGEIAGEKEMMFRKLGMWMLEVPGFRKISLFCFLWDGHWCGKGWEDGSSKSVLIFRIFPYVRRKLSKGIKSWSL